MTAPTHWDLRRVRIGLEIEIAGLHLIRARGLQGVTAPEVAQAAGISERTFYRYFRNVGEILTGVPTRQAQRVADKVIARPADESVEEAFRVVLADTAQGDGEHHDLTMVAIALWTYILESDPERILERSNAIAITTVCYQRAVQHRLSLPDGDIRAGVLAATLSGLVWFCFVDYVTSGRQGLPQDRFTAGFDALDLINATPPVSSGRSATPSGPRQRSQRQRSAG